MIDDSSSNDPSSSSEHPSQRAWTHDDIYPSKQGSTDSDSSSSDDDSSSDDASSVDSADSDDSSSNSSSSGASFAETTTPKSNKSSTNYESLSESSSSSDDSDFKTKPNPVRKASFKKYGKTSADIEQALDASTNAINKAEEQRRKQLEDIEKSAVEFKAQEKKMLDISQHLDREMENVSSVLRNSDEKLHKMAEERATKKSRDLQVRVERQKSNNSLKQMEREARLERARERIEQERSEKEAKEQEIKTKKIAKAQTIDTSEKARIERAYAWYTRMAMPSREKMKERIGLMSCTTGVEKDDIDLLPWNARGTFVSVATMMKIQRTSTSSFGRK